MPLNFRRNYWQYQKRLRELYEQRQIRVYTGAFLTLATISFFTLFALRPTFLTIADLWADIKQKREVSEKLNAKIQQLSQAQASYSQIAPRLYLIDEALPRQANFSFLTSNLERAVSQNQASFTGLTFEEINLDEAERGLQEVGFQVSLEGRFESLKGFLKEIFSLRRIIQSSRLALTKNTDKEKPPLILSVQLTSFFSD